MNLNNITNFAHKKDGYRFNRDKQLVFPELTLVLSERKQMKDIKRMI